jgi:multicomponent Na+:H+ antiporter subunit G
MDVLTFTRELIVVLFVLCGTLLMVIAAIGLYRMPDIFMRMASTSKAATLGAVCIMVALGFFFPNLGAITRAFITVVFLFLTAPIAAHMIGRAAYTQRSQLWEETIIDELRGHYDQKTHQLSGTMHEAPPTSDTPPPGPSPEASAPAGTQQS